MRTLVQAMRTRRYGEGLSLRQLSGVVGVAFSTLARIERGAGAPDTHTRRALERWLYPQDATPPCTCVRCAGPRPQDLLEARVARLEQQVEALHHGLRRVERLLLALDATQGEAHAG